MKTYITSEADARSFLSLTEEKVLRLVLTKEQREHVFGDLLEELRSEIRPRYGEAFARHWYRWQVTRSLLPMARANLIRILKVISLIKLVEWILGRP